MPYMSITVNSNAVYDALVNLIDTINSEPDPVRRLSLLLYADTTYRDRFLMERNRAAYEARLKYMIDDIASPLNVEPAQIYYWSGRHQRDRGLPAFTRRDRRDLEDAENISHLRLVSRNGQEISANE
jgi:hypothetical protein